MDHKLIETIAQRLWFEDCDFDGWPNGRPTWDELEERPMGTKDRFRSMALGAIETIRSISTEKE